MSQGSHKIYTAREAERLINGFLATREAFKRVLLLEGARQVGKSCLVEHVLRSFERPKTAINLERDRKMLMRIDACEDFDDFTALLKDRAGFDPAGGHVLFIDEAQESRRLGGFVRFMKESWPEASVILSGSSMTRLFRDGTRYPVGRVRRIVLHPYSFAEFLLAMNEPALAKALRNDPPARFTGSRHERLLELYNAFLKSGGLPAIVAALRENRDINEELEQIEADYQEDFFRIFGEADADIARACMKSVANFAGGVSKNSSVVPSPGTRVNQRIQEIFSRLEAWHMILKSEQKGPEIEAGHAYLPKRYLFDTGLLRRLRESAVPDIHLLNAIDALSRQPLGGVLENQVAIDLSRAGLDLRGWKKTPSGGEIDFIVKAGSKAIPVEVKSTLSIDGKQHRGLLDYLAMYKLRTGVATSPCPYAEIAHGERRIIRLPLYLIHRLQEITG
jgi:uncharacterized protein